MANRQSSDMLPHFEDYVDILRRQRIFQVKQQLEALLQSTAASEDPEEVAADWCEQHMLLECFLDDRRSLHSGNAVDDPRLRFPFLFSRRRSQQLTSGMSEPPEKEKEDDGEDEEEKKESSSGKSTGRNLDPAEEDLKQQQQQQLARESVPVVAAAASNSAEPPEPDTSQSNSQATSIARPVQQMSSVFNMEPSGFDTAAAKLSSYFADADPAGGLSPQGRRQSQPTDLLPPNLLVWHRYTEIPFDISSSEFTVKTPVLPLVQGGHLVFLTSQCGLNARQYTLKIIKKSSSQVGSRGARQQRLNCQMAAINKDEFLVLKKLGHPCVATLLYFCENQTLYYYFFPHYLFASLSGNFSLFNRVDSNACVYVTCCVINAVEYLYRNCIIHRDISSKSVLFNPDGRPVLFHFDYATFHGSLRCAEAKVTFLPELSTRAPEVISPDICKSCEPEFYPNCDVWGIGVLLGELLLSTKVIMRALKRKLDLHWVFSVREGVGDTIGLYAGAPKDLMELLRSCLRKQPQDRPTIHNLMLNSCFSQYGVTSIHNVLFQRSPMERLVIRAGQC